jgi:probable rRNA maturation factor
MEKPRKNSRINVHLVGDSEIRKLNKKHMDKDYPTDVLSFNIDEVLPDGEYYLGDIVVNVDEAERQMNEYGNTDIRREIAQLVEHGMLHLMGIHHKHDD